MVSQVHRWRIPARSTRQKVIVTGCYDWLHSGHVRFFEETSELGDLYVVVGHDENVRLLKGEGHPMFPQDERRYMVGAIKFVKQALISSGRGWMDAEPEIERIRPDIYAVNEDGDKPEKRGILPSNMAWNMWCLTRTPLPVCPAGRARTCAGFRKNNVLRGHHSWRFRHTALAPQSTAQPQTSAQTSGREDHTSPVRRGADSTDLSIRADIGRLHAGPRSAQS